ncbi:hypothetical protein R6Q59_006797 [Mikania micrantha]
MAANKELKVMVEQVPATSPAAGGLGGVTNNKCLCSPTTHADLKLHACIDGEKTGIGNPNGTGHTQPMGTKRSGFFRQIKTETGTGSTCTRPKPELEPAKTRTVTGQKPIGTG